MNKTFSFYKNKKLVTTADYFVMAILAVLLIVGIVLLSLPGGGEVKIYQNDSLYGTYSLSDNRTITIYTEHETNIIVIESGYVYMSDANCGNQLCVSHSKINKAHHQIICAPHGIVVVVVDNKSELDAITGGAV